MNTNPSIELFNNLDYQRPSKLINEMNDCLQKLDLDDSHNLEPQSFEDLNGTIPCDFIPNSMTMSQACLQSTPHLFREELRGLECTQSSPQINIQELSQQIKAALFGGTSPASVKTRAKIQQQNKDDDETVIMTTNNLKERFTMPDGNQVQSQFSTNYKQKNPYKSRQISIHTNAYLATDVGDSTSHKQEIFSTAQTTQMGSNKNNHQRVASNTKSFFNQTNNNTFISYDNNMINEQLAQNIFYSTNPQNQNNQIKQQIQQEKPRKKDKKPNNDDEFVNNYKLALQQYQEDMNKQAYSHKKRLVSYDQDLKLRQNLRRKIKSVVQDPAQVPMNIFYTIISYDGKLFKKFLCLSNGMKNHILFYVFDKTKKISHDFHRKYGQLLELQSRSLIVKPLSFGKEEGVRLDLSLRVKIKKEAKKIQGKSIIFSNGYNLEKQTTEISESKIEGEYQNVYQFDLYCARANRWLWLHQDECLFHGSTDSRAYSIPIVPICVEDNIEISLTLISLMGVLDTDTVRWQSLKIESQPDQNDIRDYNRFKMLTPNRDLLAKYFADLKRVCEVEDTVVEWFTEPNIKTKSLKQHIRRKLDTEQFSKQFDISKVEVGGIDFSVWKVQLRAKKNPLQEYKFYKDLNMGIRIEKDQSLSIINEIKRSGYLIDKGQDIELRSGDFLLVYVSMGGFEK
ncbi:UNKNOWN [Stylonychia lemnae]|uniref:Uncharacterized protein n=1 Tax=Stylonychia lemnae TaxID=5949 RepID=A0A078ASF8_STYLE|nr:UNKNOWN [Stylonychia lemnae]|eukprot:CDW85380.1 UNKNOWN [Stylonychia lemnae]